MLTSSYAADSQLALVITPELPVCCAASNPWDDSLLAIAGPHNVRSYRLDLVTSNAKPNNLLMLVRTHQAARVDQQPRQGQGDCRNTADRAGAVCVLPFASCMPLWCTKQVQLRPACESSILQGILDAWLCTLRWNTLYSTFLCDIVACRTIAAALPSPASPTLLVVCWQLAPAQAASWSTLKQA